jgi:hypothetical protein
VSRLARIACAAVLLAGAAFGTQLSMPSLTFACSCMQPGNVAEVAGDPNILVVTGTVVAIDVRVDRFGQRTTGQFAVERVFQGPALPANVPIVGGNGADCLPMIEAGWHVVMTARIVEERLEPVGCGHFGLLSQPSGQELLRDVLAEFGQGAGPPPAAPAPPPGVDLASIALIAVGGLVAAVLFGAVFLALGRRERVPG